MSETKLLRLPQVIKRVGLKKSMIYKMINEGKFPKPVRLGARAVAWHSLAVTRFIEERPEVNNG